MTPSRETIGAALFSQVATAAGFATSGRRVVMWTKISEFPALFLNAVGNHYPAPENRHLPPKRTLAYEIWIYSSAGKDPNAVPESALNDLVDAVEAALAPSVVTNVQTLGGIVSHCWIEGQVELFSGVLDGIAKAIVPVKILVP